ncbi:GTP cyclohydrolase I [Streptomyces sp. NPDC051644]|uniref:GTP cyclohydrolase I n=1 Tax=Streptomyces sp. NPDC051644 TaxID=3365666 RepID=UPI00379E1E76
MVLARSIPLRSVCEHPLLPFVAIATSPASPGQRNLDLSKLARVLERSACRPQVQERLTEPFAGWLQAQLEPKGFGDAIQAEHTCMTLRGVQATGTTTMTSALRGLLHRRPIAHRGPRPDRSAPLTRRRFGTGEQPVGLDAHCWARLRTAGSAFRRAAGPAAGVVSCEVALPILPQGILPTVAWNGSMHDRKCEPSYLDASDHRAGSTAR